MVIDDLTFLITQRKVVDQNLVFCVILIKNHKAYFRIIKLHFIIQLLFATRVGVDLGQVKTITSGVAEVSKIFCDNFDF